MFGRYDAIDAVKTTEPLTPSLMKIRAAARAQKKAPNNWKPCQPLSLPVDRVESYIDFEKLVDLCFGEVQSRFMVGPACVANHAVQRTGLAHNFVERLRYRLFFCYVGYLGVHLAVELFGQAMELIARLGDIN